MQGKSSSLLQNIYSQTSLQKNMLILQYLNENSIRTFIEGIKFLIDQPLVLRILILQLSLNKPVII